MIEALAKIDVKSNTALLERLKSFSGQQLSAEDRWQQKVSWVMGTVDEHNKMTRPQVESLLQRHAGGKPE